MSLTSAMSSAVSGLSAQSAALSMISQNLVNVNTTGYKTTDASFASLVSSGSSSSTYSTGGVSVTGVSNQGQQGTLTTSQTSTNMAVSGGSGFFVVSDAASNGSTLYTRNGEFSIDKDGYLTNNGYYLQGWATDAQGNILGSATSGSLTTVDTDSVTSIASGTTAATLAATLPADAAVGDKFTSSIQIYDSLGTAATSTITWEKTGANQWSATYSDAMKSDGSGTLATASTTPITIAFNDNGTFASTTPAAPTMSFTGWTTGAANSNITLDMGTAGSTNGLNQLSKSTDTLTVDLKYTQNGTGYGNVTGIEIEKDGTIYAKFDNDQRRAIYKVALSTFNNANGLSAVTGGVYAATSASGTSTLRIAGTGGAGTVAGGMLESSTTDTSQEYSNMIAAQQAYSSAAQIISTVKSMEETLLAAIR